MIRHGVSVTVYYPSRYTFTDQRDAGIIARDHLSLPLLSSCRRHLVSAAALCLLPAGGARPAADGPSTQSRTPASESALRRAESVTGGRRQNSVFRACHGPGSGLGCAYGASAPAAQLGRFRLRYFVAVPSDSDPLADSDLDGFRPRHATDWRAVHSPGIWAIQLQSWQARPRAGPFKFNLNLKGRSS